MFFVCLFLFSFKEGGGERGEGERENVNFPCRERTPAKSLEYILRQKKYMVYIVTFKFHIDL